MSEARRYADIFARAADALAALPRKPERSAGEQEAAANILAGARDARTSFMRAHAGDIYDRLTGSLQRSVRASDLVYDAAREFPGLVPTRDQIAHERRYPQKEKDGLEIDQGIFLSQILSQPLAGAHLVQAMLRPLPASEALLPRFQAEGELDLGTVRLERRGQAGIVTLCNTAYLNAEDDTVVGPLETAIDLVLLDPAIEVGVLRGGVVDHPKYAGRRVFSAGINLTHLYEGKISFVDFFLERDLGLVNKLYRGLATGAFSPDEPEATLEKPWIAAVEAFAIGGGCQLLLVVDRTIAEEGAYFTLPARKEGIIPGAANLRLPRFVGDRLARQAILFERGFVAGTPEGALLCDEVVERGGMDAALERAIAGLTSSGVVSAAANRRALRVAQEPLDTFRRYMATYTLDQASCHLSPALIRNLEQFWVSRRR